jgi:prepilin-type N-terminal cleavage/methylation domain-containing protein
MQFSLFFSFLPFQTRSLEQGSTRLPRAFTLVELLLVIGIIGILSGITVVIINPAELLAQTRDTNRLMNMTDLDKAMKMYRALYGNAPGANNTYYLSLPDANPNCSSYTLPTLPAGYFYACSTAANFRKTDGTGWIPVNFSRMDIKLLPTLPADPVNDADYFYVYAGGNFWEAAALLESQKSINESGPKDSGDNNMVYEIGDNQKLIQHPTDFLSCKEIKDAYATVASGTYYINPSAANSVAVYCDMDYSGGGWTLIFSSQTAGGLADQTGSYNNSLSSLIPTGSMLNTWTPFTSISAIRFACDGNKDGSLQYNGTATANGNAIYTQIKNCVSGLCETGISMDDANLKGAANDAAGHPDNWVHGGAGTLWGSYDDYPYTISDSKDYCSAVKYKTRVGYPTASSTSNAYFYIFIR